MKKILLFLCVVLWLAGCASVPKIPKNKPVEPTAWNSAGWKVTERSQNEQYDRDSLLWAAKIGDRATVNHLIGKRTDVSAKSGEGWTPLMIAAEYSHVDIVKDLLASGADPNLKNKYGASALIFATATAPANNVEMIRALLAKGADVNIWYANSWTPLIWAADWGRTDIALELLKSGKIHVDVVSGTGWFPLISAVSMGNFAITEALILKGANLEMKLMDGRTALFGGVQHNQLDTTKMLLEAGANVNAKNNMGATPLMSAAARCEAPMVELLLAHGARTGFMDRNGWTALIYAQKRSGCEKVIKMLLAAQTPEEKRAEKGRPLLYKAIREGDTASIRQAIKVGANVHLSDEDGRTPMTYAIEYHGQDSKAIICVRELLAQGAHAEQVGVYGKTPLCVAAEYGNLAVVKELLARGANINAASNSGSTPLHYALFGIKNSTPHAQVVRYLLNNGAHRCTKTNDNRTPLRIASYNDAPMDIIQRILDAGCNDIHLKGNDGKTALNVAANKNIASLLRRYGATGKSSRADDFLIDAIDAGLEAVMEAMPGIAASVAGVPLDISGSAGSDSGSWGLRYTKAWVDNYNSLQKMRGTSYRMTYGQCDKEKFSSQSDVITARNRIFKNAESSRPGWINTPEKMMTIVAPDSPEPCK